MSQTSSQTSSIPSSSSATAFPENTAGQLFFVAGLTGGREVFLGQALAEPRAEHLTLEGKALGLTPDGRMVVRPFQTTVAFALRDAAHVVQYISNATAREEAQELLELAATHVTRTAYPFIFRWIETAVQPTAVQLAPDQQASVAAGADPFFGLYQSFRSTTEEFRRVLFRSPRIDSTSELDRATELEGDLLIEIGKITNQAALKLGLILRRERRLAEYLEALQLPGPPVPRSSMSGWPFLFERVLTAKTWARRNGKPSLVRNVNALLKDALFGLNEVILEHSNSLDTLITETFGQYGITHELAGEAVAPAGPRLGAVPVVAGGTLLPPGRVARQPRL